MSDRAGHILDLVQHRLDPDAAVPMHWSRLVDAPIAALIVVLQPVLGAAAGNAACTSLDLKSTLSVE